MMIHMYVNFRLWSYACPNYRYRFSFSVFRIVYHGIFLYVAKIHTQFNVENKEWYEALSNDGDIQIQITLSLIRGVTSVKSYPLKWSRITYSPGKRNLLQVFFECATKRIQFWSCLEFLSHSETFMKMTKLNLWFIAVIGGRVMCGK